MPAARSRQKQAELAGAIGAGVLGFGVGALLSEWTAPFAVLLVIVGVLLHGWGMLEKHRLEAQAGQPAWATTLYWVCWIALAALTLGIIFRVFGA